MHSSFSFLSRFRSHTAALFSAAALFPMLFILFISPLTAEAANPLDALKYMQDGVDQADSDIFNQGIDVDSVVNKASDSLLAALKQQAAEGNMGNSNLGMALMFANMAENSGQGAFIKQMLVSEVKSFMASGVNGGYFAGKPNGRVKTSGASLVSTLEKMPQGRRQILPGKLLSSKDGKAEVSATFVDPEAGKFPLKLGLEERNNKWKVVEILNAQELFEAATKRQR